MAAARAELERSEPRILLVRTSALGDVVQGLPFLRALRQARPEARIAWVVEKPYAPLLEGHPDLDELIEVELKALRRAPYVDQLSSVRVIRRRLRAFRPDVAFDLMGNTKAAVLSWLSGCRQRIGHARSSRREPASGVLLHRQVATELPHAVDRSLALLEALGVGVPRDEATRRELLLSSGAGLRSEEIAEAEQGAEPFVLLHPGAGWRNKELPPERWGALGRRLADRTGRRVLAVTGPGEEALGTAVERSSEGSVRALHVPRLPRLVGLQRAADLVVGGDTGPVHLAHALGTPVLALMGPTDPSKHGPWLAADRTIVRRLPCSFCHRRFDGPRACLLLIPADSIVDRAAQLLDRSTARQRNGAPEAPRPEIR